MINEPLERIRKHGMRLAVVEGAFATVHIAITLGAFTTGLALFLGASDFQIGLLASLTPLSSTFSLISAHWISSGSICRSAMMFGIAKYRDRGGLRRYSIPCNQVPR